MREPYQESDPRNLAVLRTALRSPSRATRLRAVAMLAILECPERDAWLDTAERDRCRAVRETASIVRAWVDVEPDGGRSGREPGYVPDGDSCGRDPLSERGLVETSLIGRRGWEWEYTVEVWRADGLAVGAYFVTTCAEDDRHACSLALGQAILANTAGLGDAFDPECAATFITDKACRPRGTTRDRPPRGRSAGPPT